MESKLEKTLNAVKHVNRVEPSEHLKARLHAIPEGLKEAYDRVPKKVVWTVAASIAVLVLFNAFSLDQYTDSSQNTANQTQEESHFSYLKQL